jgi:hypothetical protein
MDEIVLRAMARWPNVPAVYGWLSLDRRGLWRIRDERVNNPVIASFIGRNYTSDAQGRWYFQNGPQKVFVALEYTPFVYRLWSVTGQERLAIETHAGAQVAQVSGCWLDDEGSVLLDTEFGIGVVESSSLEAIVACFVDPSGNPLSPVELERMMDPGTTCEAGSFLMLKNRKLPVKGLTRADVPRRFGYVQQPRESAEPDN